MASVSGVIFVVVTIIIMMALSGTADISGDIDNDDDVDVVDDDELGPHGHFDPIPPAIVV